MSQGKFEVWVLLACLSAVLIAPVIPLKKLTLSGYLGRLSIWSPHLTSLLIANWLFSAGGWGQEKHPIISNFTEKITPAVAVYLLWLPAVSIAIYVATFFSRPNDRKHFFFSLTLYVPIILAAIVFGYFMVKLASQGAGR
jgi:hypothetical protein